MFPKKLKKNKVVYLDNAAATPLDISIAKKMNKVAEANYYNPSALYSQAVQARKIIDDARAKVASVLFTQPYSIIFTGSGTESVNMAILGVARKNKQNGNHVITTKIEHHAVLHSMKQLENEGFEVTYLDVNKFGQIDLGEFKKALKKETILVSIMYANNEIGTILPIADVGREILKWRKTNNSVYPYFHSDACQAAGYLDLNVEKSHVDLLSLNGSKIYGPKGTGLLFVKKGVKIEPIIYGGGQEFALRPGTENVAGIYGFAEALDMAEKNRKTLPAHISDIRDYFYEKIKSDVKNIALVGEDIKSPNRLPNNLNIVFKGVDAESLILYLDHYGIVCSSGSACSTDSDELSHVLLSCGVNNTDATSAIRFTLGKHTTKQDIDYVMKFLPNVVEELRRINSIK